MHMIAHDAPGMYGQTFLFLAKTYAIQYNIFILLAGKYINPFYNGKAYKMNCRLVGNGIAFLIVDRLM